MNKLIVRKGYRITVVSWENDADYYRDMNITVDTKEKALAYSHIFTNLFALSSDPGSMGVGNLGDYDIEKFTQRVQQYADKHVDNLKLVGCDIEDGLLEHIGDIGYDLMGGSECYLSRVCDSVSIHYIKEDVYAEVIL